MQKRKLTTTEAARILRVTPETVKKYCSGTGINRKYFPRAKKNKWGRWMIPAVDVQARAKK